MPQSFSFYNYFILLEQGFPGQVCGRLTGGLQLDSPWESEQGLGDS